MSWEGQQGWGQGQQGQGQWEQNNKPHHGKQQIIEGQQAQLWGESGQQGQQWGQSGQNTQQWGQSGQNTQQWGQSGQIGQQGQQNQQWGQKNHLIAGNHQGGFYPNPNQIYKIVLAAYPNLFLDSFQNGFQKQQLIIKVGLGGPSQRWRFMPDKVGNFTIVSVGNGGLIAQSSNNEAILYKSQQSTELVNEKWRISQVQHGFSIRSAVTGLSLNVKGEKYINDTPVILWKFTNAANDVWAIQPIN